MKMQDVIESAAALRSVYNELCGMSSTVSEHAEGIESDYDDRDMPDELRTYVDRLHTLAEALQVVDTLDGDADAIEDAAAEIKGTDLDDRFAYFNFS